MWSPNSSSLPTGVGSSCQLRNVGLFPPDPVTNLQLLLARKQVTPDRRSVVVTVQFNWTAPEFTGEGIVGYQVWLDRMPAPDNVTRFITHGAQARAAEIEMIFDNEYADFSVILQVRLHTNHAFEPPCNQQAYSSYHIQSSIFFRFVHLVQTLLVTGAEMTTESSKFKVS